MVKLRYSICLKRESHARLKDKAFEMGIEGRGWLNCLMQKMATEPFLFCPANFKVELVPIIK